jgi:tetratricopeptide (TPR) repeat protein
MRKLILTAALAFCATAAMAGTPKYEPLPEELRTLSKKGLDAIYAVQLDEAKKQFGLALEKYPDHPFPHFGIAMAKWAQLEYLEDESDPKLEAEYGELTDKAVDVGQAWIKKHPGDANAYLAVGGIYGLRARLAVMQHRWWRAYVDGKKGISNTRKAVKIDPELYDAYLGLGMYEYYTGTLPGVVKLLAKLIMSGDANKGLEYLNLCREKGYFNALGAKLLLIEIYTQPGSKYANTAMAVKWSRELRAAYPGHPQMHFVEIVSLFEDKKYEESRSESLAYLKAINDGVPAYRRRYLPRVLTAIATTYLVEKKYDEAADYFAKAAATIKEDPAAHPARWAVWAIVRQANVYDLKGARDKALALYKEAKSYKDTWGFVEFIDKYLKKPFSEAELPGSLPPP